MIIIGGTGQCKLVASILMQQNKPITAIYDRTKGLKSPVDGIPIFDDIHEFRRYAKENAAIFMVIAIGNPHDRVTFTRIFKEHTSFNVVHRSANIEPTAIYGSGLQALANSNIGPDCKIGEQFIINANASVDHDCWVGDNCEVGPGSVLCGDVRLRDYAWVGAGAVVLPRLTIGKKSIVGAGAVVTKDVPDNTIVKGVPAK